MIIVMVVPRCNIIENYSYFDNYFFTVQSSSFVSTRKFCFLFAKLFLLLLRKKAKMGLTRARKKNKEVVFSLYMYDDIIIEP